ncbi:adenosine receptor A2b-like [Stylophora pistillata]|uniref:adenosine receptor A2b-like n=1 Tax=Stylophora pistillata TaxID=50429 RepID=UPI000C056E73|nr:adenosine receptor A2b-like [Stylophora pistillata]
MATINSTGYRKENMSFEELRCSTVFTSDIREHLMYLSAINIFLSITAFLGNTLILVALRRESSLHPPSKLLFNCLASTDLCVGLLAEPANIVYWMSLVYEDWDVCRLSAIASFIIGYTLGSVSLLTLTAISVDRLLALLLGLRYKQLLTLKRTYAVVMTFWVVSCAVALSFLGSRHITIWYGRSTTIICLAITTVSYSYIFLKLRRLQTEVWENVRQKHSTSTFSLNTEQYRKAVHSALCVQFAMVACYLPYLVVMALMSNRTMSSSYFLAWAVSVSLLYFNSSLNPFLYCWKIREVRQVVKETIRQVLCCVCSFINVDI